MSASAPIPRRDLFKLSLAAGAGLALAGANRLAAIEPIQRKGGPRFKLSLVGYSLRKYFTSDDPGRKITLFDFIDYCSGVGFGAAEVTGYYFPKPATEEYLLRLKRHAYLRGVTLSGTSVGNKLGQPKGPALEAEIAAVKAAADRAAFLGAPYLRVFANQVEKMREPGAMPGAVAAFEECAEYAGRKGVFIGLENDGGLTPEMTLDIVGSVKSPWFGLNLDLGNFQTDDVYKDVARCAPFAINVHVKRNILGSGPVPQPLKIGRMLDILRDANYQGYLAMEYEATDDPYRSIPGWFAELKRAIG